MLPCSMQAASVQALRRKRSRLARTSFVRWSLGHPGPAAAPGLQWPMQGAQSGCCSIWTPTVFRDFVFCLYSYVFVYFELWDKLGVCTALPQASVSLAQAEWIN